ncbi:hypothetical protein DM02DRAFT_648118 [Periconia macrospinosa]|uniref:Uncharacterized protein n=1 Tax=Periconia macrospinosa TaxID=97972 RepID=A0A2V1EC00_9PLEO|nr:hypothetical protein DM02DRAFT_648118 [Periconia macrospinosa]
MAEPHPFRPNLFQSAPPRGSEQQATSKKSHLQSLHHHAHKQHHHHRHSSRHHAAKEAVQSAIQLHPPTSFGDLLNKAKSSGSNTPARTESRRGSVQEGKANAPTEVSKAEEMRKPVRQKDVEAERRMMKIREEELRCSLQNLSDKSLKTSRLLDNTYYSLLEKASVLHQTLGNFQELANLTKELYENFEADTKEITDDIRGQFEGFRNFQEQGEQIAALEARLHAGREKANDLNARLAEARSCVEARAKSEAELELRNTRRLRIMWGIIGTIGGLILAVMLFQHFKPIQPDLQKHAPLDFTSREKVLEAPIPPAAKEAICGNPASSISIRTKHAAEPSSAFGAEHGLRIFDEL